MIDDGLVTCPGCGQRTVAGAGCQWCEEPLGVRGERRSGILPFLRPADGPGGRVPVVRPGVGGWRMSGDRVPWDRLVRFHPAWIVFPVLVAWLATRGEMGNEFSGPWFVFLTLAFAGHFVSRGRDATKWAMIGRSLLGLILGLLASALLLGVTALIVYRCRGGSGGIFISCDPRRAVLMWFAVAVGVLAFARVALALIARRRISAR